MCSSMKFRKISEKQYIKPQNNGLKNLSLATYITIEYTVKHLLPGYQRLAPENPACQAMSHCKGS